MGAWQRETDAAFVMGYRLHSQAFWVDVRVLQVDGRWIASADTPDGASLGCGVDPFEALWGALQPFDDVVDELLASMPAFEPPAGLTG